MYTDAELLFTGASGQTVVGNGANASTDHVDALAAGDALTPGARVVARIFTQYTDAGGGTIITSLQTCAENTFAAPTTIATGPTITIAAGAATAAGAPGVVLLDSVIPAGALRFLRLNFQLSAAMDAGAVEGFICLDTDKLLDRGL